MYLWCSKAVSGLKFSLDKSEIILVGNVDRLKALGAMFGCQAWKFLSYYFGLLGASVKSAVVSWWIVPRGTLLLWKKQFLSKEARLTHTWFAFAFYLMTFITPSLVCNHLENFERVFTWWRSPKKVGEELGMRNLLFLNKALLGKLL